MEKEKTKKRKADFDTIQIENDSTCIWLIVRGLNVRRGVVMNIHTEPFCR